MLTRNGKEVIGRLDYTAFRLIRVYDGTESVNYFSSSGWLNHYCMVVGSGTTFPTVNDYQLDNEITSLTKLGETKSQGGYYGSNFILTFQATYKNNTDSNITINEVGVCINGNETGGTSDANADNALILREVLNTPVIIQPQKTYTFSITV